MKFAMIATWRMAVEGITKASEGLKNGINAGDAIEEAIKKANEEYELLNKKYTIEVQELIWNEEEEEYINIWNNDNSLNEDSIKLVLGAI